MAQFEEPTAKRLRERLSMILPIAQLSQPAMTAAKSFALLALSSSRKSRTGHCPSAVS